MLETSSASHVSPDLSRAWSRVWSNGCIALAAMAGGCALPAPEVTSAPAPAVVAAPAPAPRAPDAAARAKSLEEARALLAQAETDVQRARSKRALWTKAWEGLLAARAALAQGDSAAASRNARLASEFAELGLEQLAYPAVK
jgi:hypothetical protein